MSLAQMAHPMTDTGALMKYQEDITVDYLRSHLSILAADSMEGRETAMPGQKKAARYLADQYRQMGLKPVGDDGTYFQHFDVNATKMDSVVFTTYALQDGQKMEIDRSVASDHSIGNYIRAYGGSDTLQGQIVFAGFGVDDSARGINHLVGTDLKGKWVMVFGEIPHVVDGDTLIDPAITGRSRFRTILSKGAAGVLAIPALSSEEFTKSAEESQIGYGKPDNMRLAYRDKGHGSRGFSRGYNLISPEMAARLLGLGSVGDLENYRQDLITDIRDFNPKALNYSLSQVPYSRVVTLDTENVLAFLEGSDPQLKDQVVVMSAHYDHLGIGQPDSTGDRIYNGADDDGSGTIGVLNVAQAFVNAAKKGIRPKRSILFLHVAGEEKGLLGSRYYSDHPVFPVDRTIADLNTDMIGRVDPKHEKEGVENYVYVIGADIISSELDSLIQVANKQAGQVSLSRRYNDLNDPNQFYRRSDHWNFGRLGIPFVFFFTGVHKDYHRPSDEVDKIRFEKMSRIVRTMYASAVLVANTENPPTVDNQAFINATKVDN
ncbi:MAG: M28 family peptidase [Balneolaceae bacterium]|jgi:hypothetical protein